MSLILTKANRWEFFLLMCEQSVRCTYAPLAYIYHRHPEIIWG